MTPKPGEIYGAYVPAGEPHLVIVVSREEFNRGDYVLAVPVTSRKFQLRSRLPNCVPFRAGEFAFDRDCVAQAEAIARIEKSDLDLEAGCCGEIDAVKMRALIHAIGYVISAECEPC